MLAKTVIALSLITGTVALTNYSQSHHLETTNTSSQQTVTQLTTTDINKIAQNITVQVYAGRDRGSGILIANDNNTYTVLTNAHVTDRGEAYTIQTPDGMEHTATLMSLNRTAIENDLAILEFNSSNNYQIATIGNSDNITEGETVMAAGFPDGKKELVITEGKISLISEKPLNRGYSIGFTNNTVQGMSGGVLLNTQGEIIVVLGKGKDAILDTAYDYLDGAKPTPEEIATYREVSFSIPIANIAELSPQLTSLVPGDNNPDIAQEPETEKIPTQKPSYTGIVGTVDNIARQITVRINTSIRDKDGSGVIIARQGNTYYVATAGHVVNKDGEYQIVTPDGETHSLDSQSIKKSEAYDFAIFSFTSDQDYTVATVGNYTVAANNDQVVFVSGFPHNQSPQRIITGGKVREQEKTSFAAKASDSFLSITPNRPGLLYSNISYSGMSGGAVLDSEGRLVGINAGAENELYFDESGNLDQFSLGFSLGVPIKDIFSFLERETELNTEWLQTTNNPSVKVSDNDWISIETQLLTAEQPQDNTDLAAWMNYGNQLWRYERFDEAVGAFNQVIAIAPNLDLAYYGIGLTNLYQGNYDRAVTALDKATQINPNSYFYWRWLGYSYGNLEQFDDAILAYEEAIAKKPDDFILYIEQGGLLGKVERYEEAIFAYNRASELNPNHSWIYNNRGLIYREQGNIELALADYNKAIQLNALIAPPYYNRGYIYYKQGKIDLALADYDQVIQIDPEFSKAYMNRGAIHKQQRKYDLALADYNEALSLNRQNGETENKSAGVYNNRGNVYRDRKQFDLALADYNEAIKLNPQYARAYGNRGFTYYQQQKFDLALADYNRAIQIDLEHTAAYHNRGVLYNARQQYDLALVDLNKALELDPNEAVAYYDRALIHKNQRNLELALADYNQAIKLDPNFARAYSSRSILFANKKDLQSALRDLNRAIELDPKFARAYFNRAVLYENQEKAELALTDYNQAIQINPKYTSAYENRGAIYLEQKQFALAIADYNQVIQLHSESARAYLGLGLSHAELKNFPAARANLQKAQQLFIDRDDNATAAQITDFLEKLPKN